MILTPFLFTALLLAGCESTPHYNRTQVAQLSPSGQKRPLGSAKLWQTKSDVPGPYEVIAILTVEGDAGEEAAFIKAFLYRCADLGGDGVLMERVKLTAGQVLNGGAWGRTPIAHAGVWRGEVLRLK